MTCPSDAARRPSAHQCAAYANVRAICGQHIPLFPYSSYTRACRGKRQKSLNAARYCPHLTRESIGQPQLLERRAVGRAQGDVVAAPCLTLPPGGTRNLWDSCLKTASQARTHVHKIGALFLCYFGEM